MVLLQDFVFLSFFFCCAFAVTVIPLTLALPKVYDGPAKPVSSGSDLFSRFIPSFVETAYSSIPDRYWKGKIEGSTSHAMGDSFVHGSIEAGAKHQHLAIAPNTVWLTILTQMSFYLRKHAEENDVRNKFNNLEGFVLLNILMLGEPQKWFGALISGRSRTAWLTNWV
jgi:hypothetical protein